MATCIFLGSFLHLQSMSLLLTLCLLLWLCLSCLPLRRMLVRTLSPPGWFPLSRSLIQSYLQSPFCHIRYHSHGTWDWIWTCLEGKHCSAFHGQYPRGSLSIYNCVTQKPVDQCFTEALDCAHPLMSAVPKLSEWNSWYSPSEWVLGCFKHFAEIVLMISQDNPVSSKGG